MANEVKITVGADTKSADQAMKGFKGRLEGISASATKVGLGLSAFGAAGVLAIKSLTSAAMEQIAAEKQLEVAVKSVGVSYDTVAESISTATSALQKKTNFGDEAQIKTLAQLIPMLGSVDDAMLALPAVMDVAAATGRDLQSTVMTLGQAFAGVTPRVRGTTLDFTGMETVGKRVNATLELYGGTAEAVADPTKQLGMAVGDLKEVLGAALLPALIPILDLLTGFAELAQRTNPIVLELGGSFAVVAIAITSILGPLALLVAMLPKLALGLALVNASSGKLGLIAIGITAAITGIILVFRHWGRIIDEVKHQLNKLVPLVNKFVVPVMNFLARHVGGMRNEFKDADFTVGLFSTTMERYGHITENALETTEDMEENLKEFAKTATKTVPALDNVNAAIKRGSDMFADLLVEFDGYMDLVDRLNAAHAKAEQDKAARIRQEQKDKVQAEQEARDAEKAAQEEQDRKNREGHQFFDSGVGRPHFDQVSGTWVYPNASSRGMVATGADAPMANLGGAIFGKDFGAAMSTIFSGAVGGDSFAKAVNTARFQASAQTSMEGMRANTFATPGSVTMSVVRNGQIISFPIQIDLSMKGHEIAKDPQFQEAVRGAIVDAIDRGSEFGTVKAFDPNSGVVVN